MPARVLTLTLLLSTCTTSTSSEPPRDEQPKPNATKSDPVLVEHEPERAPAKDAELPECPAADPNESLCTEAGKLAGRFAPVDMIRVPSDAEVIYASGDQGSDQQSLTIALRNETLWIRAVECGACRRVMGAGFEGRLDHLSPEQLAEVQKRFGIAGSELTTAEAWRTYATSDEGRARLGALVGVVRDE